MKIGSDAEIRAWAHIIEHPDPPLDGPLHGVQYGAKDIFDSSGLVTMAAALEWNLNRGQRNVRLFEIGRHYRMNGPQSIETPILTLGATGLARNESTTNPAVVYVTYIVPVGAALRIDQPDPGCPLA